MNTPADPQNAKKLDRTEVILVVIAGCVVLGWILDWVYGYSGFNLFKSWFACLSFLGSLALGIYLIILRQAPWFRLPAWIEPYVVPVLSLLPAAGYLLSIISVPYQFLTVGGSLALAWVSTHAFWRSLVKSGKAGTKPEGRAAEPTPEPAGAAKSETAAPPDGPERPSPPEPPPPGVPPLGSASGG